MIECHGEQHPLLPVLLAAVEGTFPPIDGLVTFMPTLREDLQAIVSFTGHAFVATTTSARDLAAFTLDGFGAALHPAVLQRLAGSDGQVGTLDATLVGRGTGNGVLRARPDLDDHPRVRHARALREHVRVYGDDRGLVTHARGLAGRTEISVETFPRTTSDLDGVGRSLLRDALGLIAAGEPVTQQCRRATLAQCERSSQRDSVQSAVKY